MAAKSKRQRHAEAHHSDERWLITYADMITLLMVFFIVLYSMANTDLKKFAQVAESMRVAFNVVGFGSNTGAVLGDSAGGRASGRAAPIFPELSPQQRDFVAVSSELTAFAVETGSTGDISVNMNMEGVIISLSEGLVFEPGSAELRPESMAVLSEIARILRTIDNSVRIVGHTDNVPTNSPLYPSNWELSVARAVAIVRYLVEEEGIGPERLLPAGQAEFKPLVPNNSRAGRATNRRAEIVIIYPGASRRFSLTNGARNE